MIPRLLTLLLGLVLAVASLEILLRVWQPDGAERVPGFVVDGDTGWSRPANLKGFVVQRVPGMFRTRFQTNRLGMRDRDYPIDRNGKPRILCLGDSVTEGWGVEQQETYPKVLESRYLRDVEVWNLGVVGYSTDQELRQLERVIEAARPDVVTLAFFFNDLVENTLERARWAPNYAKPHFAVRGDEDLVLTDGAELAEQVREAELESRRWSARGRELLGRVALYRLARYAARAVRDRLRPAEENKQAAPAARSRSWWGMDNLFRAEQAEELDAAWTLAERILVEVNRLCVRHGAKLVLLYVPCPIDAVPGMLDVYLPRMNVNAPPAEFDVSIVERRLADIARREGIRFFATGAAFRAASNPKDFFLPEVPKDLHIATRGHELVARLLADFLRRERMLPETSFALAPSSGRD